MSILINRAVSVIFALFICLNGESKTPYLHRTIYVYLGAQRDGLGDISANIWLAERLRQHYPDDEISIVYEKSNRHADALGTLVGGDIEDARNTLAQKKISLIEVDAHAALGTLPQADIGFFISAPPLAYDHPFNSSSKDAYLIREPLVGQFGMSIRETQPGAPKNLFTSTYGTHSIIHEAAAGVKNAGLYIDADEKLEALSRSEIQKIAQGQGFKNSAVTFNDTELSDVAFAYTFNADLQKKYIEGLSQYAKQSGKKIFLFSNHPAIQKFANKDLVEVINLKNVNFENSRRLIASTGLIPPLVTGDSSLAACIQAETPFFYEDRAHKRRHTLELVDAGLPILSGRNAESPDSIPDADKFVAYVLDDENRKKFSETSQQLKRNSSLIVEISNHMRTLPIRSHPADLRPCRVILAP
jgi:hypothetical protein